MLTSRTRFRFTDFHFFHKHKKWRWPLLYQLFIKAVRISTMSTQTKWSWDLWLTNDKASHVAQEDNICLLSVAKEATLNEQWMKPGVPLGWPISKTGFLLRAKFHLERIHKTQFSRCFGLKTLKILGVSLRTQILISLHVSKTSSFHIIPKIYACR